MMNTYENKHTYRILHSRYQPETKIHDIYREILYANPTYRSDLLQNFSFPKAVYNFLVVYEWIAFEDYESFKVALSLIYFQEMLAILANELQLTELTANLEKAKQCLTTMPNLQKNSSFNECEKFYYSQKPLIFQTLLSYVEKNLVEFP